MTVIAKSATGRGISGYSGVAGHPILRAVCGLALTMVIADADAYRLNTSIGVAVGYTDNVNLTPDGESDMPVEVFTEFRFTEQSALLDGFVEGRVGYRDYLENNASDEVVPDVHGNLLWRLDPGRWQWELDGVARMVRVRQAGPDSPGNRENQVVLETGPDFNARITPTNDLTVEARVGYLWNEVAVDDNAWLALALRYGFKQSETVDLSANIESRAVRYQESGSSLETDFSDFNIVDTFARYTRKDLHVSTLVDVGVSFVDIVGAADDQNLFLRVDASRDLGAQTKAGMRAFVGYNSQGERAVAQSPTPGVATENEFATAEVFLDKRAELYYLGELAGGNVEALLYASQQDFVGNERDQTDFGGGFTWGHDVAARTRGEVFGTYYTTRFDGPSQTDHTYIAGLRLSHRLTRNIFGRFEVRRQNRSSEISAREYGETGFFISLVYRTGGLP